MHVHLPSHRCTISRSALGHLLLGITGRRVRMLQLSRVPRGRQSPPHRAFGLVEGPHISRLLHLLRIPVWCWQCLRGDGLSGSHCVNHHSRSSLVKWPLLCLETSAGPVSQVLTPGLRIFSPVLQRLFLARCRVGHSVGETFAPVVGCSGSHLHFHRGCK